MYYTEHNVFYDVWNASETDPNILQIKATMTNLVDKVRFQNGELDTLPYCTNFSDARSQKKVKVGGLMEIKNGYDLTIDIMDRFVEILNESSSSKVIFTSADFFLLFNPIDKAVDYSPYCEVAVAQIKEMTTKNPDLQFVAIPGRVNGTWLFTTADLKNRILTFYDSCH